MKPVFDENGLATVPGDMRCFYYDAVTYEYTGWSDEYINTGISMPACSTGIDPSENIPGKVAVFTGKGWSHEEDHRNETVYSIENGAAVTVDYIGAIKNGFHYLALTRKLNAMLRGLTAIKLTPSPTELLVY